VNHGVGRDDDHMLLVYLTIPMNKEKAGYGFLSNGQRGEKNEKAATIQKKPAPSLHI
jgi:hypothetical protein